MRKLAEKSRERWPQWADPAVLVGMPEPKVKTPA